MAIDSDINIHSGNEQPSAGDPGAGSTSYKGGKMAEMIASIIILPPTYSSTPTATSTSGSGSTSTVEVRGTAGEIGNLKYGELNKVSDLLDGSSKQLQKCSLNDIMFLVMLILTKSTSEQRESRFEGLIVKKRVAREGSTAVYNMKMAEAEATYKTEEKQAEIKKIVGIVSIVAGAVSIVGGVFSGIAKNTAIAQKLGEVISEKVLTNISRYGAVVAQLISTVCTDSASLYQGIATLDLAEIRKNAAFVSAETKQTQAFFERAMKEIGDMQEAYGNSQREISTTLKSMQEALEKKQETRLSVARNI